MHVDMAVRRVTKLESLILFDLDSEAAGSTCSAAIRPTLPAGTEVHVAQILEAAIRDADLLITATTVTTGYVRYEWLKPGVIVVNVSLDDLLPEVYLRSDLLFVDDWNLVQEDTRRLLGKLHRQATGCRPGSETTHSGARKVDGEISDLVLGRHPGRKNPEDIVVVNPFGLGIEDVALASCIFQMAVAHQKGIRRPVEKSRRVI